MPMKIDYLGHSGFFVETDSVLLLFDYYDGDLSFIKQKPHDKPLFVFVSHVHPDHFNPKIFSLEDVHQRTTYLLSFDIKGDPAVPEDCDVQYLNAGRTYGIEGLDTVRTLLSTDEGVAFLSKPVAQHSFMLEIFIGGTGPAKIRNGLKAKRPFSDARLENLLTRPLTSPLPFWMVGWRNIIGKAWR